MSDLASLIERLEKCAGPDRELDADIALAMGWTECPGDNWIGPHGQIAVPEYTASLDAALTLVPKSVGDCELYWVGSIQNCDCLAQIECPRDRFKQGRHKLPALALCIAALRSRANEGERV